MPDLAPVTIGGKSGTVAYFDREWQMVSPERATLAKVVFDDGTTGFYTVTPRAQSLSGFHLDDDFEAKHPRDESGRFDEVPGSVGGKVTVGETTLKRATKSDTARLEALKVPPGWRDVHLSVRHDAPLQAVGLDAKDRTQYLYSAEHAQEKAADKFARMKDFGSALPAFRKQLLTDLDDATDQEVRDAAAVMYMIDKTAFRIGSDKETGGDKTAYGATTLKSNHVKIDGDKVTFRFTGKKGVVINKTVRDALLAKELKARMNGKERLFTVSDSRVREYMQERMQKPFTPKDFRSYYGTARAYERVKALPMPKSSAAMKKAMREVAKDVSRLLGNTPSVALKSYIDPVVWSPWKAKYES